MIRLGLRALCLAALCASTGASAADGVVVIGNQNIAALDAATLQKIYTGRVIEVNGVTVIAVNANSGSPVRARFLQSFMNEDEDRYTAYWIARRYMGQGAPPRELSNSHAVINYVKSTPGAIGYIDEQDVQPGLNVLLK